jgi:hypothetical protein
VKELIEIRTVHGPRQVLADVEGFLAVHQVYRGHNWTVTHVPTGVCMPVESTTREMALDLRQRLSCLDWDFTDPIPRGEFKKQAAALCRMWLADQDAEQVC